MVDVRLFFTRCAAAGAVCVIPLSALAQSHGGLSRAQLARLHQLGIPIVGSTRLPAGFRVSQAAPLPGNRSYRIVYANAAGASITFEGGRLAGATASKPPPQKHGFLQRLFGNIGKTTHPGSNGSSSTSSEAEGQGTAAIAAYSPVIGTARFTPSGPCLRGVADSTNAQVRNEQVRVSGCNFDDPQPLIDAYKNAHRL